MELRPLLYSSAKQITLVVRFEVAGPSTQIIVSNGVSQSTPLPIPVAPTAPAVLTSSQLGSGQIAALNEDGSANSAVNPAAPNSVVSIFATGLGQSTPGGVAIKVPIVGAAPGVPWARVFVASVLTSCFIEGRRLQMI